MAEWEIILSDGAKITIEADSAEEARQIYMDIGGDYKEIFDIVEDITGRQQHYLGDGVFADND